MTTQQNLEQQFNKIANLLEQIQNLGLDSEDGETNFLSSLHQFETVALPFELVQQSMGLWEAIFPPEVLESLATEDPDTLESLAIALSQTLQTQLAILNPWLPLLTTPPALADKIRDRTTQIQQITTEKAELLAASETLFHRELELRQEGETLQELKQTRAELTALEQELATTDLDDLRQEISNRKTALKQDRNQLESLKQQQTELEAEIAAIQGLNHQISRELEGLQLRRSRLETRTQQQTAQLITLTETERQRLGNALPPLLAELAEQQSAYQNAQGELSQAIADFNRYQQQTHELITHLNSHYQTNRELGQKLPVNQPKIETIMQRIQDNLAELDRELAIAQQQHERSQEKTIVTF
jgi:DNA repair exonuclease SbcCD ATPase subunit